MKTIIAGCRHITGYACVKNAIEESGFEITQIVSGCALGVDTSGEFYAISRDIPMTRFPADWKKHGKAAGPIRNQEMGDYAEALIAVWDGESKGTKHMIEYAKKKGLKVFVKIV